MATRRPQVAPQVALELKIGREAAAAKIQARIDKAADINVGGVKSFEDLQAADDDESTWSKYNSEMLRQMFTVDVLSSEYDYSGWAGSVSLGGYSPSLGEKMREFTRNVEEKVKCLRSIMDRLELIPVASSAYGAIERPPAVREVRTVSSKRVFVVHGHDDMAKTALENFLHGIGLEPIVLHRQADRGDTVIEKIERYSDVVYAFILLTPDEVAYLAAEEGKDDAVRVKHKRARPNVIFEFGFFVGKLTRERVCCLYTGGVEIPSDLNGLVYKHYQTSVEEVAMPIIRDLKAAGIQVNI